MSSMFIDDLRRSHRGLAEPGDRRTFEVSYGKIAVSVDVNVGRWTLKFLYRCAFPLS